MRRVKLPGHLYGVSVGKALGAHGRCRWGLYINWGKWSVRFFEREKP